MEITCGCGQLYKGTQKRHEDTIRHLLFKWSIIDMNRYNKDIDLMQFKIDEIVEKGDIEEEKEELERMREALDDYQMRRNFMDSIQRKVVKLPNVNKYNKWIAHLSSLYEEYNYLKRGFIDVEEMLFN